MSALPARQCSARATLLAVGLLAAGGPLVAQCTQGAWSPAFHHEFNTANTNQIVPPGLSVWPPRFNALHMTLIAIGPYRGHLLVWDLSEPQVRPAQRWSMIDPTWEPGVGRPRFRNFYLLMPPSAQVGDLFCAGHCQMRDGRLLVAGGTLTHPQPPNSWIGAATVFQFAPDLIDPVNGDHGLWRREGDLIAPRWYPWVTMSHDDSFVIAGGTSNNVPFNSYEVARLPQPGQVPPAPITFDQRASGADPRVYAGPVGPGQMAAYVRIHMLTGGEWFASGPHGNGFRWSHDPALQPSYDHSAGASPSVPYVTWGTNLIDPRGGGLDNRILRIGGTVSGVVSADVQVAQADQPGPWLTPPALRLNHPRHSANAVLLPSGEIFVVGGFTAPTGNQSPELIPELWNGQAWVDQPPQTGPRGYHSTAVLLPDGRVFVGGGDTRTADYQIFSPPYLTCGRPRPQKVGLDIPPVEGGMRYQDDDPTALYSAWWDEGQLTSVRVRKVVLLRPGSVTHHADMDARYLELPIHVADEQEPAETRISFRGPRNSRHAPRGWYMLFLVSDENVPSEARWVHLQ